MRHGVSLAGDLHSRLLVESRCERHEVYISKMTGQVVTPDKFQIIKQIILARIFGFTFSIMMSTLSINS